MLSASVSVAPHLHLAGLSPGVVDTSGQLVPSSRCHVIEPPVGFNRRGLSGRMISTSELLLHVRHKNIFDARHLLA